MGCNSSKGQRDHVLDPSRPKDVDTPVPGAASTQSEPEPAEEPTPTNTDGGQTPPTHIPHAPSMPAIRSSDASGTHGKEDGNDDSATGAAAGGHGEAPKRSMRTSRTAPASGIDVQTSGFKGVPEIPSFTCSERNIAPFSLPAEVLTFVPPKESVISVFKNGDSERKIHLNIELSESEQDRLAQMRQVAKAAGDAFYPSVAVMATRFLSRARMDPQKAVHLMKNTQAWRKEFFKGGALSDEQIMEDMKHGIVYFCGRDSSLRPAIVVRANRIPEKWYKEKCIDRFIRMLIFCMEYFQRYMVVPGRVENLNVIVDLSGLGVSQVPISALSEVYSVMSHHYIGRVYKFYVCNVSWVLSTIAGMAKALLTDRQKQKLNMLDSPKDLQKDFALHQLETDLGGSRPVIKEFFPFPLQPGPYQAGYAGGPDSTAKPGAWAVLSSAGAMGRLWNSKLSAEENTRLEYAPGAAEVFQRIGLPVPPEARMEATASASASAGAAAAAPAASSTEVVAAVASPEEKAAPPAIAPPAGGEQVVSSAPAVVDEPTSQSQSRTQDSNMMIEAESKNTNAWCC